MMISYLMHDEIADSDYDDTSDIADMTTAAMTFMAHDRHTITAVSDSQARPVQNIA